MKHDSTAPKVRPEERETRIAPRSMPDVREAAWKRFWTRVRLLTRDRRFVEVVLSVITFLLATLLLASLDRALRQPQFSEPPYLPAWMIQPVPNP
jgi:hypothetical protein